MLVIVSAGMYGLNKKDFTKKIKKIDSTGLCVKETKMKTKLKKCKDGGKKFDIPEGVITQNSEGVFKIEYAE